MYTLICWDLEPTSTNPILILFKNLGGGKSFRAFSARGSTNFERERERERKEKI